MIEVIGLAKRFRLNGKAPRHCDPREHDGWFHAVRDVSLRCAAGEVLGLLDPNCASKTTTLRPLSTALTADAGTAMMNRIDILREPLAARRSIGFLSGTTGLYGRLTARENIEYFGRLHGMSPADLKRRCDELFDLLQVHDFGNKRADQLSTGMKQKCAIARTVRHYASSGRVKGNSCRMNVSRLYFLFSISGEQLSNPFPQLWQ